MATSKDITPAYSFATLEDLHGALASSETQKALAEWLQRDEPDYKSVVKNSVEKSTFRGLSTKLEQVHTVPPKIIYTDWAAGFLNREADRIKDFTKPFQVRNLVDEGAVELCKVWLQRTGSKELGYGKSAKLVNLLLKHFVCLREIKADDRSRIYRLLDTPLDRYSLGGIRTISPALRIPKNASMGWVKNFSQYRTVQGVIRDLCAPEYYPLDYDILTYNLKSQSEIASEEMEDTAPGTELSAVG